MVVRRAVIAIVLAVACSNPAPPRAPTAPVTPTTITAPSAAPAPVLPPLDDKLRVRVATGHQGEVQDIVATPDGAWIATFDEARIVRVIRSDGLYEVARFFRPGIDVLGIALSDDGARVAVQYSDAKAAVYDVASGAELGRFDADASVGCLLFDGADLVAWHRGLVRWRDGTTTQPLAAPGANVCTRLGWLGPKQVVVVADAITVVGIDGAPAVPGPKRTGWPGSVSFAPGAVTWTDDAGAWLWRGKGDAERIAAKASVVGFLDGGRAIYVLGDAREGTRYDVASRKSTPFGGPERLVGLGIGRAAVASMLADLCIVRSSDGSGALCAASPTGIVRQLVATRDGLLLVASDTAALRAWELGHPTVLRAYSYTGWGLDRGIVGVSVDQQWAASPDGGAMQIWSIADDRRRELKPDKSLGTLYGAAFSPDGAWVTALSASAIVSLRVDGSATKLVPLPKTALATWFRGRQIPDVFAGDMRPRRVAYRPDGAVLAVTVDDHLLLVRGDRVTTLATGMPVGAFAFRPNSKELVVGFADGRVGVWDTDQPGKPIREVALASTVGAIAFDTTGELAIATQDGTVHRFDAKWAALPSLVQTFPTTLALAYLRRGRLAVAGLDGIVRIANLAERTFDVELYALPVSTGDRSDWAVIRRDGRFESSLAGDGSLVYGVRERAIAPVAAFADERRAIALVESAVLDAADRPVRAPPGPEVVVQSWETPTLSSVRSLVVTPNGRELVAVIGANVFAFDVTSGLLRRHLGTVHEGHIAVTADQLFVATGTGVEARDLASGARIARGTDDIFTKVAGVTAAGEIVSTTFTELEVYSATPFARLRRVAESKVAFAAVSADGKTIGVLHEDGSIRLRDAATLAERRVVACGDISKSPRLALSAGTGAASFVACETTRGSIVVQRGDGSGAFTVRPDPFQLAQGIYDFEFHPTKPVLAIAAITGVFVVDLGKPGGAITRLEGARVRVDAVAWLGDSMVASVESGGDLLLHDATTGARIRRLDATSATRIATIARAEPGTLAFGEGRHLRTWNAATGHEHPFDEGASRYQFAWSADGGAHVVVSYRDKQAGIAVTNKQRVTTWIPVDNIDALVVTPDARRVYAARARYRQPLELVAIDVASKAIAWRVEIPGAFTRLVHGRFTNELAVITDADVSIDPKRPSSSKVTLVTSDGKLVATRELPAYFRELVQLGAGRWIAATHPLISRWDGVSTTLVPTTLPGDHLALSIDDKRLVVTDDHAVRVVDAASLAVQAVATNLPASSESVFVAPALLATLQVDGTVALRTVRANRITDAGRLVAAPGRGTILIAPDGSYMAEPAAARAIGFTVGRDAYRFEQFDRVLNRPHAALAGLGLATRETLAIYEAAYLQRVARSGAPPAVGDVLRAPRIDLTKPVPAQVATSTLAIELRASAPGRTLSRIGIRVNGIPVLGRHGKDVAARKASELTLVEQLPLEIGMNRIELEAENDQGVAALGRTILVTRSGTAPVGKVIAVAVGVSSYKEAGNDLRFASKDAEDFVKALASSTGKAATVEPIVLRDTQVTRTAVLGLRKRLETTKSEDIVVMFVSGHGLLDPGDNQYVFGTHDVKFDAPKGNGIRFDELEGLLDGIPARRRMLLLDTCHAGELDPEELAFVERAQREGRKGVRRVPRKPAPAAQGIDPRARAIAARALFTELRGSGITVLASSAGAEYSYEDQGVQNGLFTRALVDGLGGKADRDKDGAVRVTELLGYLATTVSAHSAGFQIPQARQLNRELDFDLTPGMNKTAWEYEDCGRWNDRYECGAFQAAVAAMTKAPATEIAAVVASMNLPTAKVTDDTLPGIAHVKRVVVPNAAKGYPDVGLGWIVAQPATQRIAVCFAIDALPAAVERCKRVLPSLVQKDPPQLLK